jgi:hypothetical protein
MPAWVNMLQSAVKPFYARRSHDNLTRGAAAMTGKHWNGKETSKGGLALSVVFC